MLYVTLAEAKSLKQYSSEAINVLVYIIELTAHDPILSPLESQELWKKSQDEAENAAPKENSEELV